MSDRKSIEARIEGLRAELAQVEGTSTEVYSRIVGYYRSVRNWNAGKREEYRLRKTYDLASCAGHGDGRSEDIKAGGAQSAEAAGELMAEEVLVFTRETCPNCPPVANYVMGQGIGAILVDVDCAAGLELARRHGVLSTPTVLGLDSRGNEAFRAFALGELKARFGDGRMARA